MKTSKFERFKLERRGLDDGSQLVGFNQIRFVCNDSDRRGIHVKSTLDNTFKLDGKTDESISFRDNDLIVIKNVMDRPVEILLESIRLADGRRCIFHPSRQSTFNLTSKEESEVRSERELVLGPGEACTVHSSCWVPAAGAGARVVV